jgi:phage terminase small subunit
MPRARSPNRDKAFEIWKASKGKKKNKDIASELGVSEKLISRWKQEDSWKEKSTKKSTNRKSRNDEKIKREKKQQESLKNNLSKSIEENDELTEKQKLFCLYWIDNRNATQAYLKAHQCSYNTARTEGNLNLTKPCIKREIEKLKKIRNKTLMLDPEDIVEKYMKIAFANITDFVMFSKDQVWVYGNEMVDGGLISEVKQTKSGVSIKLENRMKALEWLSNYFNMNPMDKHKIMYDNAVLDIRKKEAESKDW